MKGDEKMKTTRKIIAIVLTVLTIMSVMSVATPVFAAEITDIANSNLGNVEEIEPEENGENESEVLNEMVEWRTESTKYFRNSDGSYTAAQYAYPVHYKENGEWKEIDNTLTEQSSEGKASNSDKMFIAKNTNTPAKFPNEFKQDGSKEITVTAEGYEISFSPKGNQKGFKDSIGNIKDRQDLESVKIVETANQVRNEQVSTFKATQEFKKVEIKEDNKKEKFKVENKSGTIVYEDVFNNTDIEYELNNSKIKESIILKEKQDTYVFKFNMDLGELCPVMREDGSIDLCADKDGENPAAKIEAPYMIDSAGEYSDAVAMEITENDKEFVLTVTADEKWLNSKKRVYPVVIDPTIDLDVGRAKTYDCYIDNSQPNTAFPYDYYIYAGYSSYGKTRAYVKFDLPDLPDDSCIITNASITFYQYSLDNGNGSTQYMTIHNVTKNWNNADRNVTWNNDPSYDSTVLDYCKYDPEVGHPYQFDITKTVKSWYEGGSNYGVMLKSEDESVIKRAQLLSAENTGVNAYPVIEVSFLNNKGIESYWSYSSYSVNDAGAVHINDYTGNLVYELPIASSISEIMPVSIVGYYNNYCANELICETESKDVRTSIGRGFRLNYQRTVLPSSKYGLTGDNATLYPYVYTDEDGTEHYIQKTKEDGKTVYKDEDGLGLTFTTGLNDNDEVYYKITDKAHSTYYFNFRGNLSRIKDNNGNEMKIIYKPADSASNLPDRSRIDKIVDGAGHTYTFAYAKNSSDKELDYVRSITDDAGRVVDFDISDGLLTYVKYPNKDTAFISYNISSASGDSEGRINAITSNDVYCLNFDYTSKATGRRVNLVKEYGLTYNSSNQKVYHLGQVITFDRTKYNTTIMRSCGMDGTHGNDDDIITTVQYDNMGRAISQQMKLGSGKEIGAGSVAYTSTSDDKTASGFKNKVSGSGATGKHVENLLYDGNAETQNNWAEASVKTLNANGYITTTQSYMGENSLLMTSTSISEEHARRYFRQIVTGAEIGEDYTLSAYVKTDSLTAYSDTALSGAFLELDAYNSSGTLLKSTTSQVLSSKTETTVNNGWRRLSTTITVPENTATLRVYLVLRNVTGTAYFDCIQLERGSSANDYNMLENTHFTKKSTNTPTSWSKSRDLEFSTGTSVANGVVVTENAMGNNTYAMKITGEPNALNAAVQTVAVDGNPNDTYILSGWGKANAVNSTFHTELTKGEDTETTDDDEYSETALFEIGVRVNYSVSDGTTHHQYKPSAKFNTTISDWQCASVPIVLKCTNGESGKTYTPTSIRVILKYKNQENCAYFDKIMLVKDAASSYTYDDEGNLISAASNSEQKSNMEYDDNNNLTSYTDTAGFTTTASYDDNNNMTLTKSAKGSYTRHNYSTQGNVEITETRNASTNDAATAAIRTNNDYNEKKTVDGVTINAGAYQTAYRDQNNKKTTYTLDHETGALKSVTDAKNVVTNYEYYDTFGKQKSVATGNSKVSYEYDTNERLSKIILGNSTKEEYSFVYSKFGNVTQTLVGSQPLSTNTYKSNNGAIEKTTYGNGDVRRFEYNNLGQKTATYGTDASSTSTAEKLLYSWTYNDSGVGLTHTDHVNDLKYIGDYDSLGRLSKEEVQNSSDSAFIGSAEYGYDVRNNLTSLITNYGGDTRYQYYYYSEHEKAPNSAKYAKDNLPTYYQLYYNSRYAIYDYDGLNRLTQRKFTLDTPLYYNYIYKSSDRNGTDETKYRTTQISKEFIGNDVYIYGYDVLGNITSIKKAVRKSTDPTSSDFKSYTGTTDYVSYTYDDLGQLTEEKFLNKETRKTWLYDELGNITNRNEYKYVTVTDPETNTETEKEIVGKSVVYTYTTDKKATVGWNNLLTSVKTVEYEDDETEKSSVTETITYDKIGNPTTYLGAELKWNGRQLTSYTTDDKAITYTYDANGLRASKIQKDYTTTDGAKTLTQTTQTKYYYVNGQLHFQDTLTTKADGTTVVTKLYFYYDSYGYLTGIKYNGTNYYVATNKRGDVVALYYPGGKIMGRYEYDAWGNVIKIEDIYYDSNGNQVTADLTNNTTSRDLLVVNPIRYRSYYYDNETDLYYLQSRYYNAQVGRFLNSDSISDSGAGVLGFNTFIYCANNPVNASDPSGHFVLSAILIGVAVGAVVGAVGEIGCQVIKKGKIYDRDAVVKSAIIGGVCGAISGGIGGAIAKTTASATAKFVAGAVADGCVNTVESSLNAICNNETLSVGDYVYSFASGVASAGVGEIVSSKIISFNSKNINTLTPGQKRGALYSQNTGEVFNRQVLKNGKYMSSTAYKQYIKQGSDAGKDITSGASTLFFCFFEEETT